MFPDVAHVRRLEEENAFLARILDEKEKESASLARTLKEKEKESAARDHYDKALADRLSIVAEGLAGDRLKSTCVVFAL